MTCHQPLPRCGDSPPGRDQWKQPSLHHRTEELQTPKPGSLGYNYNYHHICHRFTVSPTSFNITSFHGKKPGPKNAQGAEVESTQGSTKGYSTGVGIQKFQCHFPQLELLAHRNGRIHHDLAVLIAKKHKKMIEIGW